MKKHAKKLTVLLILLAIGFTANTVNAGLVASYKFDDGTANDSSGNGHNGILKNKAAIIDSERGKVLDLLHSKSGSVNCGGENVPGDKDLTWADITEKITLSAWIKTNSKPQNKLECVISKGFSFELLMNKLGKIYISNKGLITDKVLNEEVSENTENNNLDTNQQKNSAKNEETILTSIKIINDNKWHHVAVVYDGKNRFLYIDGMLDASDKTTGQLFNAESGIIVGNDFTNRRCWKGFIDDVSIFNHALNQLEIFDLSCQNNKLASDSLQKLLNLNKEAKLLSDNKEFKKLVGLLENGLKNYEKNKSEQKDILAVKILLSDLYLTLANAKEKCEKSKEEIVQIYKKALNIGTITSKSGDLLLGFYKQVSTEEYESTVLPLILNNNGYLQRIASTSENIMQTSDIDKAAIKQLADFLQANLSMIDKWRQKNQLAKVNFGRSSTPLYFQLAHAKQLLKMPKEEIVDAYQKMYKYPDAVTNNFTYQAFIWLMNNDCNEDCEKIAQLLTEPSLTAKPKNRYDKANIEISKYYESKQDWAKFTKFINVGLDASKKPSEWALFIYANLDDQTWKEKYDLYLNNLPSTSKFKIDKELMLARKYMTEKRFEEALKIFKTYAAQRQNPTDKLKLEFEICNCCFESGNYSNAIPVFDEFISKYKKLGTAQAQDVMLLKGQSYIHLDQIDKALETFFSLMAEYPNSKNTPGVNFFIGYCYMLQTEYIKAKEAFNAIIKSNPGNKYAAKARMYITRIDNIAKTSVN